MDHFMAISKLRMIEGCQKKKQEEFIFKFLVPFNTVTPIASLTEISNWKTFYSMII